MSPKPASKFTFDTEFRNDADIVSHAARARQKKTFTTAEIEAMCAHAREEGAAAGQVRATEDTGRSLAALIISLRAALEQSHAEIQTLRQEAAALALAAARKIAPAALAALPADDVEAALRAAMHQAIGEPRILLRTTPEAAQMIGARVAEIGREEGYEGRVMVSADPGMTHGDCRLEWRGGGAERSRAVIEAALENLIERHFSISSAERIAS